MHATQNAVAFALVLSLSAPLLVAQTHPGQVTRTIACPSPCPTGLAARGNRLWVVDRFTDKIYELDRSTGEVQREMDAPCYQPYKVRAKGQAKIVVEKYGEWSPYRSPFLWLRHLAAAVRMRSCFSTHHPPLAAGACATAS